MEQEAAAATSTNDNVSKMNEPLTSPEKGEKQTTVDLTSSTLSSSAEDTGSNNNNITKEPAENPKLFVTTSDVLNELNKQLQILEAPGESESNSKPRFELQKRLPDGSAIPASPVDVAAADMQTKLQQAAGIVASLKTQQEKKEWAEYQRQAGNHYFGNGDYKAAMDIYLTCLVVKDDSQEFIVKVMTPVLNNLAQCALQLGMYKKTLMFCTIALEEMEKQSPQLLLVLQQGEEELQQRLALAKLYFKRAKAGRLTGIYPQARKDLDLALHMLHQQGEGGDTDDDATILKADWAVYEQAIQKERGQLQVAEREGRRNRQRQQRAMQRVLGETTTSKPKNENKSQDDDNGDNPSSGREASSSTNSNADGLYTTVPRKYSTIRSRRKQSNEIPAADETTDKQRRQEQRSNLSYWQYYCLVVARVAEMLLEMIGDDNNKAIADDNANANDKRSQQRRKE
jgi:tetratricopeptide (TPR) repeat protein